MLENKLKQLGLDKNEIRVYLTLFEIGKARAGVLIRQTGLHRNLVYTGLKELVKKELVSRVLVDEVMVFEANDPTSLIEMVEEKKNIAQGACKDLEKFKAAKSRDLKVRSGQEGIVRARERMINVPRGETMCVFASAAASGPEMEKYWRKFHKQRISAGVKIKMLYEQTEDPFIRSSMSWRNFLPLTEAKWMPAKINAPMWMAFCKDMLDIGIPGEEPLTFSITSAEAVKSFRQYFDYFWQQQVAVESGVDALRRAMYEMLEELEPGEEYFVLGASAGGSLEEVQKFYDELHRARIKKGVVTNMLVYNESYLRIKKRFAECGDPAGKISRLRVFAAAPPIPMQINIYKNRAVFIIYSENPTIIKFNQPGVAESFKAYFRAGWK